MKHHYGIRQSRCSNFGYLYTKHKMGRNTEIYTFDKEKSSKFLYNDLQYKRFTKRTFSEYIAERTDEFGPSVINTAESILNTVKADINYILPDDLSEIINFISEEAYAKFRGSPTKDFIMIETEISHLHDLYGIELLYEVHTSTVCYSYMFQFGNYENYFPVEYLFEENGCNISSDSFYNFNEYMVFLMYRIMSDKTFDVDDPELMEKYDDLVNDLQVKLKDNLLMHEVVNNELTWLKECFFGPKDSHKPEKNTVYYAHLFFKQSIEMNERISGKNARIVIVDSI